MNRRPIVISINIRYVAIGLAVLITALSVREGMPLAALGGALVAWGLYKWQR